MANTLLLISLLAFYCLTGFEISVNGNRLKHIENRIQRLEIWQDRESASRREDMLDIFQKLDNLNTLVNDSLVGRISSEPDAKAAPDTKMNDDSSDTLAADVMIMKKAFGEEKARWRREASQIEDAINELESSMTETVTTDIKNKVQEVSDDVKTYVNNVIRDVKTIMDISNKEVREDILALKDSMEAILANCSQNTENTHPQAKTQPSDCLDLYNEGQRYSGAYTIYPEPDRQPLLVYCDMDTDGGGWTVFQRRHDGSEDFYRGWDDYVSGFGDVESEFWSGLEHISKLTGICCHELRVDLEDKNGKTTFAKYSSFRVLPSARNYKLQVGGYSGDAGDRLAYQNGMQFSTKDRDNDNAPANCAKSYESAWWYNYCFQSDLNGKYSSSNMYWISGDKLVWTEMKVRRA